MPSLLPDDIYDAFDDKGMDSKGDPLMCEQMKAISKAMFWMIVATLPLVGVSYIWYFYGTEKYSDEG